MTEAQQTALLDLAHDAIIIRGIGDQITYWNRGAERLYGWTRDEARGRVTHELLATKFPVPLTEILAEVIEAGRWDGELIHTHKDGHEVVVDSRWSVQRDSNGVVRGCLEINRDITARKKAEASLREAERRMHLATEATGVGIWEWNLLTDTLRWDAQMFKIYGRTPTSDGVVSYNDWRGAVLAEDLPRTEKFLQEVKHLGRRGVSDFRILRHDDGACRHIQTVLTVQTNAREQLEWLVGTNLDITERDQADEALRQSEARLSSILQNINGCIYQMDTESRFVHINRHFEKLFDLKAEEVRAKSVYDVFPHEIAAQFEANNRKVLSGRAPVEIEEVAPHPDGLHTYISTKVPQFDSDGNPAGIVGISIDITERKRRERNLAFLLGMQKAVASIGTPKDVLRVAGEKIARHLELSHCSFMEVNEAGACTVLHDHAAGQRDLTTVERIVDLLTDEEFKLLKAGETVVIDDVRRNHSTAAQIERFAAAAIGALIAASYAEDDDRRFVVHASRSEACKWSREERDLLTELAALVYQRLHRACADQALAESEHKLRLAMEASATGLWDWDVRSDVVIWSPECYPIFGVSEGQFNNAVSGFNELVHPDDRERVWHAVRTATDQGLKYQCEFRICRPDGEVRWVANVGRAIYDERGEPLRMLGMVMDITERKQTEQALVEVDQRKDEFLAILAHELRNPLAPLRTGMEILKRGCDPLQEENIRQMMDRALTQTVRLVDDLMDISRIRQGKLQLRKQPTEIASIVRMAVELSRPLINDRRHDLTIELPAVGARLDCDPSRLAQVIANLLNNAAKYSPAGGQICLSAAQDRDEVRISVKDSGIGISPNDLPRVFGMFAQVESALGQSQGGLGIGLSLAKQLVEMHGGRIEARSDGVGKGSEFVVYLPASHAESRPDADSSDTQQRQIDSKRILIADDNFAAVDTLAMLLELDGHQLVKAYDGEQALRAAESFRPEIVLLDIGMPKVDGYEVAQKIRATAWGGNTKIIAMSGWAQEKDHSARGDRFDHYLIKPVNSETIAKLLAEELR